MPQDNQESQDNQNGKNQPHSERAGSTSTSMLEGLQSGDGDQWKRFEKLYSVLVTDWCKKPIGGLTLTYTQIQDIMQEVFISVYKNIQSFDIHRENRCFRAWLRTITKNIISDFLDKHMKDQRAVHEMKDQALNQTKEEQEAEIDNERHLLMRRVLDILKPEFTEQQQEILHLYIDGEKTSSEVAEIMGMKPDTVRKIKNRALKRIRQECIDLGLEEFFLPHDVQLPENPDTE